MDTLYTVIKSSTWESEEVFSGLTEDEKNTLVSDLKDQQYKTEVMTDSDYAESQKEYDVFVRDWWRYEDTKYTGRRIVPGPGEKTYIAYGLTLAEARRACKEYNNTHEPGELSRKAEFEES